MGNQNTHTHAHSLNQPLMKTNTHAPRYMLGNPNAQSRKALNVTTTTTKITLSSNRTSGVDETNIGFTFANLTHSANPQPSHHLQNAQHTEMDCNTLAHAKH